MAIAASLGLRTCVKISRDCEAGDVHFVVPDIFDVNCHWSTEALQQLSVEAKCTSAPAAPTVEQMRIIREFVHARSRGNMPDVCAIDVCRAHLHCAGRCATESYSLTALGNDMSAFA
jgi:hypothetical protein